MDYSYLLRLYLPHHILIKTTRYHIISSKKNQFLSKCNGECTTHPKYVTEFLFNGILENVYERPKYSTRRSVVFLSRFSPNNFTTDEVRFGCWNEHQPFTCLPYNLQWDQCTIFFPNQWQHEKENGIFWNNHCCRCQATKAPWPPDKTTTAWLNAFKGAQKVSRCVICCTPVAPKIALNWSLPESLSAGGISTEMRIWCGQVHSQSTSFKAAFKLVVFRRGVRQEYTELYEWIPECWLTTFSNNELTIHLLLFTVRLSHTDT